MDDIERFFTEHALVGTLVATSFLVLSAMLANFLVKALLLRLIRKIIGKTSYGRDEELSRHDVARRLANVVPAVVIALGIAAVPGLHAGVVKVVENVSNAFIILTLALAVSEILNIVDTIYHRRAEAKRKPLKGYLQVAKIAVFIVAFILIIATIVDQSPVILLSGLGAITAVLILVFQDTLLGLVAGIQISSTDMVRVGDWIEVPGQQAEGDVIEIALHTVKIRNFDKTISSVPIRKLVLEPFKNWRGMQESGGRRIKRSINLDQASIRFLTEPEIERLSSLRHLSEYLDRKTAEIAAWNSQLGDGQAIAANTRRITNVGTFRAYATAYLAEHPRLHKQYTNMVRQLQPGPEGLPLEIYCFTDTVVWTEFEGIQADIFDHLYSIVSEFGLSVFQAPSGADLRELHNS